MNRVVSDGCIMSKFKPTQSCEVILPLCNGCEEVTITIKPFLVVVVILTWEDRLIVNQT